MPYKSKAQMRKFFAMESRGELEKGTARTWAHHTPKRKALPERVGAAPAAEMELKKSAFRVLAKTAMHTPPNSTCRRLALALGQGQTLKQAFDSCRVPASVRVKVARVVMNRMRKQAVLGLLAAAPAIVGAAQGGAQAPRGAHAEGALRGAVSGTTKTYGTVGGAGLGGYLANNAGTSMGLSDKLRAVLTAAGIIGGGAAGHWAGSAASDAVLGSKPTWERLDPSLSEDQDKSIKAKPAKEV